VCGFAPETATKAVETTERAFFDREALARRSRYAPGFDHLNSVFLGPFEYLDQWLSTRCAGRRLLDLGSGTGTFAFLPAKYGASVVELDISEASLRLATARLAQAQLHDVRFCAGEGDYLPFADHSFDVVMSINALLWFDLAKLFPELRRVLKPGGSAIFIDTMGHNPVLNFARSVSVLIGRRTRWIAEHVIKMPDLERFERSFPFVRCTFFDLATVFVAPFSRMVPDKIAKQIMRFDRAILRSPLRKYAFKVVIEFATEAAPAAASLSS
jgi:ubiquinone/menaquinone biosynthesis C-methylase UbiE